VVVIVVVIVVSVIKRVRARQRPTYPLPDFNFFSPTAIINKAAGKAVDKSVENFYVGVATGGRTAHAQPIFKSYYDYMNYLQGKYK